jgi:flagellar hook-associated protein 2
MATITSPGVGSGLDIKAIIDQLMAIERRPLEALQKKRSAYQAQLSAYGKLKSALASFRSALNDFKTVASFKVYKTSVEDETVFTAKASSSASPGSYDIEVVQLATAHRLNSARYADKDTTTVGNSGDKLRIQVGSNPSQAFEVTIGGHTLAQIRDAINNAADNVGVTATIVPDYDTGTGTEYYRLVITSNETGTANAITLSFKDSTDNPIADPMGFAELTAAQDAKIKVQGYLAVRASNTLTDVIDGVTLELKAKTASGVTKRLTVERDIDAIAERVQKFADAYNTWQRAMEELRTGDLKGDLTLVSIESGVRNVFNTPPSGLATSLRYLAEVGLSIQVDGTMKLDRERLADQLKADFNGVAELFAHEGQGYVGRLQALMDSYLRADGLIASRESGLDARLDFLADRQQALERRLATVEERLRAQFMALDAVVGRLRATSDYLSNQLARR